jgi:hypothetical protein
MVLIFTVLSVCRILHAYFETPDIACFCSHLFQGNRHCIHLLTQTSRYLILHASAHTNFKVTGIAYICSHKFQGNRYCIHLLTLTSRYQTLHTSAHTNFKVPDIAVYNACYLEISVSRCMQ